jgi:hypothetical protein
MLALLRLEDELPNDFDRLIALRGDPFAGRWAEDMQARFPAGTFKRIKAVLAEVEDRTDFVREAVERELKRRERGGMSRNS